ncbi:MAG: hypothetical protein ACQESH_09290 [Campylobacterota bacterium]
MTAEKITVTIPHELKERLVFAKNEMNTSMSAIYKEALENYLEKKEIEKWERGFDMASKDEDYMMLCKELGGDDGGLYELNLSKESAVDCFQVKNLSTDRFVKKIGKVKNIFEIHSTVTKTFNFHYKLYQ